MGRKCTVNLCESSSNRLEDQGVTFHKLPVNENVKLVWLAQCHLPLDARNRTVYVCSRHFRRVDFQTFKGTKYMLKTGAIPSMFAWGKTSDEELEKMCLEATEPKTITECAVKLSDNRTGLSNSTENVDNSSNNNISRTECNRTKENISDKLNMDDSTPKSVISKIKSKRTSALKASLKYAKSKKLPDSAALPEKGSTKKTTQTNHLQSRTPSKEKKKSSDVNADVNGGSPETKYDLAAMNLVPGSRVEVKDFNDQWTTVRVVEVDNDENEILIEFEKESNKSEEWIPMNSSRLRPIQIARDMGSKMYSVGERCMARWTDSRKFPATVRRVLENDIYEVLFDDGYIKKLTGSHLSRIPSKSKGQIVNNKNNASNTKSPTPQHTKDKTITNRPQEEWCFRWEGNYPVGKPGSIDAADGVKRTTVIVDDPRLPTGWIKHVVKRYNGSSAGKWDIVIVNPNNRKFRSKKEIDTYFLESKKSYNPDNFDFSLHRKRAKEIGWDTTPVKKKKISTGDSSILKVKNVTPKMDLLSNRVPVNPTIPVELNNLEDGFVFVGSLKVQIIDNLFRCPEATCYKNFRKENLLQMHIKHYHPHLTQFLGSTPNVADLAYARTIRETAEPEPVAKNRYSNTQFYEKVAKIDAIHKRLKTVSPSGGGLMPDAQIKTEPPDESILNHSDLTSVSTNDAKIESVSDGVCKLPTLLKIDGVSEITDGQSNAPPFPEKTPIIKSETSNCPLLEEALRVDSPARRNIKHHVTFDPDQPLVHHYKEPPDVQRIPGGGIKRLLPIKREELIEEPKVVANNKRKSEADSFIKPNTTRKSLYKRRGDRPMEPRLIRRLFKRDRRKKFMKRNRIINHDMSYEQDENLGINSIEGSNIKNNIRALLKTESTSNANLNKSLHGDLVTVKSEFPEQQFLGTPLMPDPSPIYITEDGEKIKLVRMRREEIINCACGFPEEDGLMMQCELCLCWQHATCLGIARESEVPERYVCAICSAPRAARLSRRYIHDQEWLLEGRLPSLMQWPLDGKDSVPFQEFTRSVHEATGNALELMPVMKSLRAKLSMAAQTDHPKFYYWAKPWKNYNDNTTEPICTSSTSNTTQYHNSHSDNPIMSENISPTLQAIHRDLCSSENESEVLGAQIENEMNLMKSKNIMALNKINQDNCVSTTFPTAETPSRGLNIDAESKVDDFTALVKSDVFDANVDISAILESNDAIPTDSELVSILEGDLKSENDLNSPARLKNGGSNIYNSETETDDECKNDPTLNMDLLSFMAADDKTSPCSKSSKSIKSTSSGDLDSQSLLAPLLASPGGTKFDLVSDRELEKFAESVGQQVLINTHPVPEEAIDNDQCRWNLLRHIDDHQTELESSIDQLNNRLATLLTYSEAPAVDLLKVDRDCSKLFRLMQRDLRTLEDTCSVPIEQQAQDNSKNVMQPQQIHDRSLTPTDMKQL